MPNAPSYQSIATFDYVVSPHGDDFGPFTVGTLTGGIQEALNTAGEGGSVFVRSGTYTLHRNITQKGSNQLLFCEPGVTLLAALDYVSPIVGIPGMLLLGWDGTTDYDGFVFEGNGCLFDGASIAGTEGPTVTGRNGEAVRFALRNFRVQNCSSYGIVVGRANLAALSGSVVGFVTVENFDVFNSGGIRVWAAEHVLVRNGRCRKLPSGTNMWFLTSQHQQAGQILTTRDVVFDDVLGNSNTSDFPGGFPGTYGIGIEGNAGTGTADLVRDLLFRRCVLRTNSGVSGAAGGVHIHDQLGNAGPGLVESVLFEDCTFDGPTGIRQVGNASEGYVVYDHCDLLNSAGLPTTTFFGGSVVNRPLIVRRPASAVTYPDQNIPITVGASPFTYTNIRRYIMVVVVSGGTVSSIQFLPRGGAAITTGETAGAFYLSSGDAIRVTYSGAPTMTAAPWF